MDRRQFGFTLLGGSFCGGFLVSPAGEPAGATVGGGAKRTRSKPKTLPVGTVLEWDDDAPIPQGWENADVHSHRTHPSITGSHIHGNDDGSN